MGEKCRVSGEVLTEVLDLGNLYLNDFPEKVDEKAPRGPLRLGMGGSSGLLQLFDSVQSDLLYRQYWYRSGTNATMTRQLADIVDNVPCWRSWSRHITIACSNCLGKSILMLRSNLASN